jgi:hypothetical protein
LCDEEIACATSFPGESAYYLHIATGSQIAYPAMQAIKKTNLVVREINNLHEHQVEPFFFVKLPSGALISMSTGKSPYYISKTTRRAILCLLNLIRLLSFSSLDYFFF